MAELTLPQDTCLSLRAQAHTLNPVVLLGAAGLSDAALKEIDRALTSHGLVKVKAGKLERDERDAMFLSMADRLGAARIQVIGHTFVLFRPIPEKTESTPRKASAPARKPAKRAPVAPARRPARQR
jgi:putative YhbY family RNA-binding protein